MTIASNNMSHRVAVKKVQEAVASLQTALDEGWRTYSRGNAQYDLLEKASQQLRLQTGADTFVPWYASEFDQRITNPAHMELARLIGEHFVEECAKQGISLAVAFPGKYSESLEMSADDAKKRAREESHAYIDDVAKKHGMAGDKSEARRFIMPVYMNAGHVGDFTIDFVHTHEHFGFAEPPHLAFTPQWKEPARIPILNV